MRRLLVLRPEPGASTTLKRAVQRGLDAFAVPLFEIEPIEWQAPQTGDFDGLLLTSANAVTSAGEALARLQHMPVFAVGDATAEAARKSGFSIAAIGAGGVDRLLASIGGQPKLLHLCGEDRVTPHDPAAQITPVPVYRAKPVPNPDLGAAPGAVALVHSARAGRRFAELAADRSSIAVAAISRAAAEAVDSGWAEVEFAAEPTDDALLALAARLCNKPPLG